MDFRDCIKPPIPEIFTSSQLLLCAVNRHIEGQHDFAAGLFAAANLEVIRYWSTSFWDKRWRETVRPRVPNLPEPLPFSERDPLRMPTRLMEAEILDRDGYVCRYCGIPVVPRKVREKATKLYPTAVPWGRSGSVQHAAFQAMLMNFDHIVPHSRGGSTAVDNLVVSCTPCNFGRGNLLLEEVGLNNPIERVLTDTNWNGLVEFLAAT